MKPLDDYERRDRLILRHVALYGVLLNAAVSKLFFSGKQAGQIIRRLADEGLLELFARSLPGGITYAKLTKSGCIRIGAAEKRSRPLSGHALQQAIAILCYCILGSHRRHRLTHAEMKRLYGERAPAANIPHVLLSPAEFGRHIVLRVHFAAGTALDTIKQVKRHLDDIQRNPTLADASGPDGSYGFLLLAPTEASSQSLLQAVERHALREQTIISVAVAPNVDGLAAYLRAMKG